MVGEDFGVLSFSVQEFGLCFFRMGKRGQRGGNVLVPAPSDIKHDLEAPAFVQHRILTGSSASTSP